MGGRASNKGLEIEDGGFHSPAEADGFHSPALGLKDIFCESRGELEGNESSGWSEVMSGGKVEGR